jgi:predicted  nucleic acid-binding Zn-ribbon protein
MGGVNFLFPLLTAVISVGGVLIAIGVLKSKVTQNTESNAVQGKQIEDRATKEELSNAMARANEQLAVAIKHSDEMLELMRRRAEEDRAAAEQQYRDINGKIGNHAERIKAVETAQKAIDKSLEEIKSDLKAGFAEIKAELKERRKD